MIRLGCYNVHNFTNSKFKSTTSEIADVIGGFDVCGIQEADYSLNEFKKCDKNFQIIYTDSQVQNGLVFNTRPKCQIFWKKFYKFKLPFFPRGVLSVYFSHQGKPIHIYVTHLDHKDEDIRLAQINKLHEIIKSEKETLYKGKDFPHIIIGDLNSLTREDYTEEEWKSITKIREDNHWEPPRTEVMNTFREWGYHDIVADFCAKNDVKIPLTSRFDTRVDYILSSTKLNVSHAGAINSNASDHLPIFANIHL